MACRPRFPLDDSWLFSDPMTLELDDDGEPLHEPWLPEFEEESLPEAATTRGAVKSGGLSL